MTASLTVTQASFPDLCPITAAVDELANAGGVEERGAIFTRREVVDFILDLCGYTTDQPLPQRRLLEPSFGDGDFLLPAIDRLLAGWKSAGSTSDPLAALGESIRAVELHRDTFHRTHAAVVARLLGAGIKARTAAALADRWLLHGDFLLVALPGSFDLVIGNPPYVRQELIPAVLLAEYRSRYSTIYDRADLYIPFIERSLTSLAPTGVLGFICADRWMKNRYGGPLRELVAREFHLRVFVDMTDTPAFHTDVIAYPAITVIAKDAPGPTRVAERPLIQATTLSALAQALRGTSNATGELVRELQGVAIGDQPWVLHASAQIDLVRRVEADFPLLEASGCKVGIGVATGADRAFIGTFEALDVEPDRKLPLAMTRDILSGHVVWRGFGVINPFTDAGPLVDLAEFPRLRRHLEKHRAEIVGRHVAQKAPANWYRTIDRITPSLASRAKLLIPDIKGQAQVVFEEGKLYPHHNLYYVLSDAWELRALQAVLLSSLTRLFIASYSTKMRGGFLRFQAQYLRRIRLPQWESVTPAMRQRLALAAVQLDLAACNEAVADLYSLTWQERETLAAA